MHYANRIDSVIHTVKQYKINKNATRYYNEDEFIDLIHTPYHVDLTDDEVRNYCH